MQERHTCFNCDWNRSLISRCENYTSPNYDKIVSMDDSCDEWELWEGDFDDEGTEET